MTARISLDRTNCTDDGGFTDYAAAVRALRQHGKHSFGCIQFVAAEAYMLGSKE